MCACLSCRSYRYFARKLDEKETTLIGDIKPKKLEGAGEVGRT